MISSILYAKWFRLSVLFAVLFLFGIGAYGVRWLNSPIDLPSGISTIELLPGDSLSKVGYRLQRDFGLKHVKALIVFAKINGLTRVRVGEYELPAGVTPVELLHLFNAGRVKMRSVTLVEGITFRAALDAINQLEHIKAPLGVMTPLEAGKKLEVEQSNPEGWLFPDTYAYSKQTTAWELVAQAHQRMLEVLEQEWAVRAEGLPYETPYEALIMASIVEKETGAAYERAEIAGVFVRRLNQGMRLQTDPTVIYGLGESYTGNIRRKHLRQKTDYNTYTMHGLPPTPIALPGREAIHAALHPQAGSSLYFVARGDGTHYFSDNLAEHESAIAKYQLQRSNNYRSTIDAKP